MPLQHKELVSAFRKSSLNFIKVEIRTGLNFADRAYHASDEQRRRRDRANARKAYDSASSFLNRHGGPSTEEERENTADGLRSLKSQLEDLGERFGD
jgi:hypothetical protein